MTNAADMVWRWLRRCERGSVMALALVVVFVMACMTGAFCQYYVNLTHLSNYWIQTSGGANRAFAHLGAEVEKPIADLLDVSKNADAPANFTELKKALKELFSKKTEDGKLVGKVDGVEVIVDANALERFDEGNQDIGAVRELEVIAVTRDAHGGIAAAVREVLKFEIKGEDDRTGSIFASYPIFDYAYFVNNYGHLESKGIVVNGNVGSNDRFTIDSAVVNGYVDVHGSTKGDRSFVRLKSTENRPRIWPYGVYMDKVAAEYRLDGSYFYTQVRPTNPIYVSASSNMTWKGGYEPPGTFSYYGGEPGVDKEPQPPEAMKLTEPTVPTLNKTSYPPKPEKVYPPEPEKEAYPEEPKKVYPTEPKEPTAADYPTKPTKISYPSAPVKKKEKSGKKNVYYLYDGTKYYGKHENDDSGAKKNAEAAQKKRETEIDAANQTALDEWKKKCDKIYSDYKKKHDEWDAECKKIDDEYPVKYAEWEAKKKKIDDDYAAAVKEWEAKKKKIDEDYDAAVKNWEAECATIDGLNATHEQEYNAKYADYLVLKAAYDAEKEVYDAAYSAFELEHAAWETWKDSIASGTELELDFDLYHKMPDAGTKKIINVTTNFVVMPNVSDVDAYRNFCMTNKVMQTNLLGQVVTLRGGRLTCANRFNGYEVTTGSNGKAVTNLVSGKDIVWKYNYAKWIDWHILRLYVYPDDYPSFVTDMTPYSRTLTSVNVTGGYDAGICPFRSGDSAFNGVADVEKGSVILIGTENYPITINGPVYFDGDVVIRGFVSGQGTIYSGRNIHIIGDVTYLNPPNWPHANLGVSGNTPREVAKNNRHRDMLMLVARGNIVVGDYTKPEWGKSFTNWVNSASSGTDVDTALSYCNVVNDTDIGYPRDLSGFKRNYLAKESGGKILSTIDFTAEKYKEDTAYYQSKLYYCLRKYYKAVPYATSGIRHYESRLGGAVIAGLMQGSDTTSSVSLPSSLWQRVLWGLAGHDATHVNTGDTELDYSQTSGAIAGIDDAGDITAIDAVLFANHGIFGIVGGSNSKKFTLNGGIVCRDEGLLPQFKARSSDAKVWINWDMRWSTSSQEANNSNGSPTLEQMVAAPGGTSVDMSVTTRHQIPLGK